MIRLFVRGSKDGKIREVEHVPLSRDKRVSLVDTRREEGRLADYYHMRICGDDGTFRPCIIREDRIEFMNIPDVAKMELYGRKHG